ncbi:DUF6869 domain-containing protein [Piscinibacter sp.]|uniref:DUF6869 domain-containing protein n=1 Tax=Piscinibacter sp. TaxID=1903157 RepID=UPI0039E56046
MKYHERLEQAGDLTGSTNVADEYLWAIERLDDVVTKYPEDGWRLVMELFMLARSDYQLACLASGALEDLLARHGRDLIDRVEQTASMNARFREMLAAVWQNAIADDVWARVKRAVESSGKA